MKTLLRKLPEMIGFLAVANAAYPVGRHARGSLSRTADAAFTTRYLVAKLGDSDDDVAICGATDKPLGVCTDEIKTADLAERQVNVEIPYLTGQTSLCIAAVAINTGDELYTAAAGKVTNVPVAGCYRIGRALTDVTSDSATAGAEDALVEFSPVSFGEPYEPARYATTCAVANTAVTPNGDAQVTGQVQDGAGNAVAGRFAVHVWITATDVYPAADLGDLAAAANTAIVTEHTTDGLATIVTHSDGSWGLVYNLTSNGTVFARAAVVGPVASATAAITGN